MIKYFVTKNFRGTCSSVEMLKGYMHIFQNAEGSAGFTYRLYRLKPRVSRSMGASNKLVRIESMAGI